MLKLVKKYWGRRVCLSTAISKHKESYAYLFGSTAYSSARQIYMNHPTGRNNKPSLQRKESTENKIIQIKTLLKLCFPKKLVLQIFYFPIKVGQKKQNMNFLNKKRYVDSVLCLKKIENKFVFKVV